MKRLLMILCLGLAGCGGGGYSGGGYVPQRTYYAPYSDGLSTYQRLAPQYQYAPYQPQPQMPIYTPAAPTFYQIDTPAYQKFNGASPGQIHY